MATRASQKAPRPSPARRRVCHVSTVHTPFDTRIFRRECRSLARAGYEVHLLACGAPEATISGVRVHPLPVPPGRVARILGWPWLALWRALALRPALAHLHDPELLVIVPALRLAGVKVVYDVHENVAGDLLAKPYLPPPAGVALSWAYRLAESLLTMGVATLHVLPEIARRYRRPKAVVRNLPDVPDVPVPPQPRNPRRPRLLYLGVVSEDRGAMTMIGLAAELDRRGVEFELRIVGPIHQRGLAARMRQAVADRGLLDKVELAGLVPYEQALKELRAADVGLCLFLPSPNNLISLPNKLLEYMAVGLPVVATNFDCWREYVTRTGSGVQVDVMDVGAIADGVQYVLDNPGVAERMGRRGQQAVGNRYNWEHEQRRLLAFYERLLGREDPP